MKIIFIHILNTFYVKYLFLFIIIGINFNLVGQEEIFVSEKLKWNHGNTQKNSKLSFDGCDEFVNQNYSNIIYKKRILLDGFYVDSKAKLVVKETTLADAKSLPFDDVNNLKTSFEVMTKVVHIRNKDFLELEIIPFRRKNNVVEKLVSFDVEINNTKDKKLHFGRGSDKTASNSVLKDGTWYKIAIEQDGVYKINRNHLADLGIDIEEINPQQINIYGNGGELLPFDNATIVNNEVKYDDLQKNSIFIAGEQDGSFDQGDYILFYGKGADRWQAETDKFEHTKHYYSDSAYYFLRIDDDLPKRIVNFETSSSSITQVIDKFIDYKYIENNTVNFIHSGRNFFGEEFDQTLSRNFSFNFPNITEDPVLIDYQLVSRSMGQGSSFAISQGSDVDNVSISNTSSSATANYGNLKQGTFTTNASNNSVVVNLTYNKANPAAVGWLDYLRVNAMRDLQMVGAQMHFRTLENIGIGNVSEYHLSNAISVRSVWDITDLANVSSLNADLLGNENIIFKINTEELHQFIAFTNSNFLSPRMVGAVENQNLHGINNVDFVIVSSPLLVSQAEELAELHREDGLTVEVVTPMEIFNEFSSGNPDVTAIKLFMKHLYDNAEDEASRIKNLLIFGDAAFNGNKNVSAINSFNVICYESLNSVSPTNSYVTDDYFVLLDDDAADHPLDELKMGVGRIPASSVGEAESFVEKVRIYMKKNTTVDGGASCLGDDSNSAYGPWRNLIVFVADDRDGNGEGDEKIHMQTSDNHANNIYNNHNDFNVVKLYMDAFQQFSTPGGERYPEGESAIRKRVENGALLVTYIGHGGERGWAHERILNTTTIQNWTNINRLPVFFTATCELARFDYPAEKSAGELLILNPNGGAIAMLTTTRIVYTAGNASLGSSFFDIVLEYNNIPELTLGEIMRVTKNGSLSVNTKNFSLLGDPALKIAYPKKEIYTTEINGYSFNPLTFDTLVPDTVKALQEITVKGYVGNEDGSMLSDFNGFIYPSVYDKKSEVVCLNNDDREFDYSYEVYKSIIYRGKATVSHGEFEFTFIVPKDINFTPGTARISYYAVDNSLDANGSFEKFVVGGISDDVELNDEGPEIDLFLNDTTFVFGGITNEIPILIAKIKDENGVNTTGNGIGHNIKGVIDNEQSSAIVLNDNYESDLDTYKSGEVRYQLDKMSEGVHNISLKVWDVQNNSSEGYTEFVVAQTAQIALNHVLNYPNPFTTHTDFYFEHNQSCEFLDVQIQVFTISGKLVKTINKTIDSPGFRSEPISWDGKDDFGDRIGRGVYVYRVKITSSEGKSTEKFEKLVILK